MGVIATAVKHMLQAGLDEDAIVAAVAEMEANNAPGRSARQERNRRYYEKKASEKRLKASEQDVSDAERLKASELRARVEDISQTQINTSSKQDARNSDLAEFKAEMVDLDTERLDALLKHRRKKGAQITGHSARLFLRDVAACGISVADAVDACISRNWITVKPDWLQRPQPRGSPSSSRPMNASEILRQRREQVHPDDDRPTGSPRLIASR